MKHHIGHCPGADCPGCWAHGREVQGVPAPEHNEHCPGADCPACCAEFERPRGAARAGARQHPETGLREDELSIAYTDLLAALAQHEPAAVARAAAHLQRSATEATRGRIDSPGAVLGRTWLAFFRLNPLTGAPN